jgi:hypothetical protein
MTRLAWKPFDPLRMVDWQVHSVSESVGSDLFRKIFVPQTSWMLSLKFPPARCLRATSNALQISALDF